MYTIKHICFLCHYAKKHVQMTKNTYTFTSVPNSFNLAVCLIYITRYKVFGDKNPVGTLYEIICFKCKFLRKH